MNDKMEAFARLLTIMDELRDSCPWDREQTIESLRHLTIEETYELSDAILSGDLQQVKQELGDLMLHIVFYSKIGSEQAAFDIRDVLDSISEKLIVRHPHIYGDRAIDNAKEVKNNWEQIKLAQGNRSVLAGVPQSLPALLKAYRMQEKAGGIGFEWEKQEEVWEKVEEELEELKEELSSKAQAENIEEEFGDLLFALVNYARYIGVNPEDALEKTNRKFKTRFEYIEQQAGKQNKLLHHMSLKEMDELWNEAKSKGY